MSCYVTLGVVLFCYVMLCHAISYYIILYGILTYYIYSSMVEYTIWSYIISYHDSYWPATHCTRPRFDAVAHMICTRNLPGWLETRLAQNTLTYFEYIYIYVCPYIYIYIHVYSLILFFNVTHTSDAVVITHMCYARTHTWCMIRGFVTCAHEQSWYAQSPY